jgi:hypothetical protein
MRNERGEDVLSSDRMTLYDTWTDIEVELLTYGWSDPLVTRILSRSIEDLVQALVLSHPD